MESLLICKWDVSLALPFFHAFCKNYLHHLRSLPELKKQIEEGWQSVWTNIWRFTTLSITWRQAWTVVLSAASEVQLSLSLKFRVGTECILIFSEIFHGYSAVATFREWGVLLLYEVDFGSCDASKNNCTEQKSVRYWLDDWKKKKRVIDTFMKNKG